MNATLRLRRELEELGHEVRYFVLSTEDLHVFRERGIEPIEARLGSESDGELSPKQRLELGGFYPEFVLIDAVFPEASMIAWYHGMRVIKLCTTLSTRYNPSLPPVSSPLRPTGAASDQRAFAAAWEEEYRRNEASRWMPQIRSLSAELEFPYEWVDERSAMGVTCRLPELVLAPRELEFEHAVLDDQAFAGPCVDLERTELGNFAAADAGGDKPLIYCAFGTQQCRYADWAQWMQLVLATARTCSELQFLIAADVPCAEEPASNVRVVRRVPQLAVLRAASLMVSHAGFNSVKEALCFGVPLVLLPFDMDQPGTAARVEHHGFGRAVSWKALSSEALSAIVRRAVSDEPLRARTRALGSRLRSALAERHAAQAFIQLCERYAVAGPRRSSRAS